MNSTTSLSSTASPATAASDARGTPAIDRLASTAHTAIDQAAAKAAPMVEKVSETVGNMSEMQSRWMQSAREQVRERPLSAVAVGLLAGWLIARLGGR